MSTKDRMRRAANERSSPHIPSPAATPFSHSEEEYPSFRFGSRDENKYCLHEGTKQETELLFKAFAKYERYTWNQVRSSGGQGQDSGGIGFKPVSSSALPGLPSEVPSDVRIHEMRVNKKMRILGYRVGAVFYLVWYDREHDLLS